MFIVPVHMFYFNEWKMPTKTDDLGLPWATGPTNISRLNETIGGGILRAAGKAKHGKLTTTSTRVPYEKTCLSLINMIYLCS